MCVCEVTSTRCSMPRARSIGAMITASSCVSRDAVSTMMRAVGDAEAHELVAHVRAAGD